MKEFKQVLSIFLALLMLAMSVPLAFAKDASCPHTNMYHFAAHLSEFCGSGGNIEYWECYDCGQYFADEAATQPLTYGETRVASDHDYLYDVGFEENPNKAWLSIAIWKDAISYCEHGMSYRDYLASQGGSVTAKYCSHCGVVIIEDNGNWSSSYHPGYDYYLHEPGEACTHEPEPGTNVSPMVYHVGATVALCGTSQVKDYWYCGKCGRAFADREATQPVTASQLVLTSPYAAHDFQYDVGFEDKGNGEVWLGTTSFEEASCQENYGMTVAERFASEGYTAQYCENCGVVIKNAQNMEIRTSDLFDFDLLGFHLFVCPIPELAGTVKLPTSPEGLATGEKWVDIANCYNAVFAFTPHPKGEDGFMTFLITLAYLLRDDYYLNEATQELFGLDQYGEVQSWEPVFLRTVGDEETAIALPSSSEGLAAGEKWFDAASFYQDLVAKYGSLPDAEANQEMFKAFAIQLAAAQIYLSPDGSTLYAKGCNTEIAEFLEDEGAPTEELAAMLNGGNWFLSMNLFLRSMEGDALFNALDYVKTVEGGACAHVWNDGPVTKNATCTEAGIKTFTCTVCGDTREEIVAALGHDWNGGKVDKEPTITETGVCIYTCNTCKTTKSVTVPKMDPTPLVNELNGQKSLKDIVDDGTVFFEDEANLPADTVFDYEIIAQSKYLQVFDLTLTSDGKKVEPEAPVWVKLPIPQGWNPNWISVWHGTEKLPSFAEGGYVYFLTTHFSEFQVKYEEQKPEEPKPDNNDNNDNTNNQPSGKVCKFCGQVHTGFFQKIIGFFHSILALFGLKKK